MKSGTMTMAAAVMLAGAVATGCNKKDSTAASNPPTHTTPSGMTVVPTTSPAVGDKANATMQSATDKMNAAGAAMSADAQKMADKMHATTMPSMPSMTPDK